MVTFKVATVDGKEITIELDTKLSSPALGELIQDALTPGGWLFATEVIQTKDREAKRADIMIFGSAIVAIRFVATSR